MIICGYRTLKQKKGRENKNKKKKILAQKEESSKESNPLSMTSMFPVKNK